MKVSYETHKKTSTASSQSGLKNSKENTFSDAYVVTTVGVGMMTHTLRASLTMGSSCGLNKALI